MSAARQYLRIHTLKTILLLVREVRQGLVPEVADLRVRVGSVGSQRMASSCVHNARNAAAAGGRWVRTEPSRLDTVCSGHVKSTVCRAVALNLGQFSGAPETPELGLWKGNEPSLLARLTSSRSIVAQTCSVCDLRSVVRHAGPVRLHGIRQ